MPTTINTCEKPTYSAEAALTGANNKDMFCIMNPSGSGKVFRVCEVWAVVSSLNGSNYFIPFEIRKTTTLTGGTSVTPMKWDSNDASSAANFRHTPTGLTDAGIWSTFVKEIDKEVSSISNIRGFKPTSWVKPLILYPNEGLYLKQISNNSSTFRVGALWTEDVL
jgi:hypothetical protein